MPRKLRHVHAEQRVFSTTDDTAVFEPQVRVFLDLGARFVVYHDSRRRPRCRMLLLRGGTVVAISLVSFFGRMACGSINIAVTIQESSSERFVIFVSGRVCTEAS
jgi:hypothetical protein